MIQNWIKIAFRNFAKNKLATFINVFGLTLGLVGLIFTLLYRSDQYSYDDWSPEKDRIFAVGHYLDGDVWGVSNPQIERAKEKIPEIEDVLLVGALGYQSSYVTKDNHSVSSNKTIEATSNFFDFFPYSFVEGSPKTAIKSENEIAISEDFAKKLDADGHILNQTVNINGKAYVVKGVYRIEGKSAIMPDVVIPFTKLDDYWGNYNYNGYFKTRAGVTADELVKKFHKAVWEDELAKEAKEAGISVEELLEKADFQPVVYSLKDSRFEMANTEPFCEPYGNRTLIQIMLWISILILIISVVNFINLSLAGAIKRAKEVGVRKAIGAGKTNIIAQSLFETFLLCLVSVCLALVTIELGMEWFNRFMNVEIKVDYGLFLMQILGIVAVTSLLTGLIPALYVSKFKAVDVLKGSFSRSSKGIYLRNAMLGLQFMIAAFFMIGSLAVYKQVNYLNKLDLGFNKEQIMVLNFNFKTKKPYEEYQNIKTYLQNLKGVTAVSSARPLIGTQTGWSTTEFTYQDKTVGNVLYNSVDFGYAEMMEMKLLKGRFLSDKFASDTLRNIVINETLAKQLGIYDDPVNKKLSDDITVVGMVKDYHVFDAFSAIQPTFMLHWKGFKNNMIYNMGNIAIKFKPEDLNTLIPELESYWQQKVTPGKPFEYSFLDKNFEKTYEQYDRQQKIFGVLTSIVILIALLGLYALSSFIIEQRLKEVAIRKTLGAESKDLVSQFTKPYMKIGVVSILLSFPLAWYAIRFWLENFAYRIAIPWDAFVICMIILLVLSFLVVSLKAMRAARMNPVEYLKYE